MKIRKTCPKKSKYYIRRVTGGLNGAVAGYPMQKYADVLDNCVGGANGRFNEIINDPELKGIEKPFKYQLVCDAEDFIESAKKQGLKISQTPVEGGIMVWRKGATLSPSDGAGHVAVVERVYDDGSILTSESGWASWAWKTVRRDNSNGRWGQNENYTFRGCVINPSIKNPKVVPIPPLTVDGVGGACTIRAMQRYFKTPQDGVISGQNKSLKKYYPSIKSVEYGNGGSACIKKLQKWCGVTADGVLGEKTIKAWQKKLGVTPIDGIFGANSMKAWQKFLNKKLFGDTTDNSTQKPSSTPTPTPTASVYKVIDVSDWQSKIDWAKVKADGVVGAIIRYADGNTLDKRFAENMKNAKANGIHIGSYIFSRAKTKAEAEKEAERLYNACKPYSPDMPLYIDLEVASLSKYANTVAQAFLNKMSKLGGRGGVYANLNWWNNYLVDTANNYSSNPFWIAQYNDKMTHKNPKLFGMWQYTSSGKVNGINGKVDMDHCYVAYWESVPKNDPPKEPEKKGYSGEMPSLVLNKTNAEVKADATRFASMIAGNNEFHYGHGKDAHHNGCYYCGTQPKSKKTSGIIDWQKTYCCNPFVHACFAHGGCIPKALELCQKGKSWAFDKGQGYDASSLFDKLGKPKKDKLEAADVLCNEHHTAIYLGNGKIAEAATEDDNVKNSKSWNNSIHIASLTDARYKGFDRVYRFNSSVSKTMNIYHGEISRRVMLLQNYLKWYGCELEADGIFGDATFKAVKKFQKENGLTADGIVGSDTLGAMAKVVK